MINIGIDLGGTNTKIGIVEDGKLLATDKIHSHSEESMTHRLPKIKTALDRLLSENELSANALNAIGLAFPSVVDNENKTILSRYVKFTDAHLHNLSNWARESWGIPLALENDARAALVGEWKYGAGKEFQNLVMITLGTGVGSAVLIDGSLFRGSNHFGGNLGGHTILNLDGEECNCGSGGCVETEASGWVLDHKFRMHPMFLDSRLSAESEITFAAVFEHAENGDLLSIEIRKQCMHAWAANVYNFVHNFDPEAVIIGGGVMNSGNIILSYIQDFVDQYCWQESGSVMIKAAEQSDYAGILGMAYLAGKEFANRS